MNGNRPSPSPAALAALLFFSSLPAAAQTQGVAPAMFNVKEVVVQYAHFGNPQTAEGCGLSREDLAALLNKELTLNGVPAIAVTEAKPAILGTARIEMVPDIFSFNSQGLDCTSWVSLAAESRNSVHIPPVDVSRNVMITYWREGVLLASSQATHQRVVGEALQKLARKFAQQYKLDQPAEVPAK